MSYHARALIVAAAAAIVMMMSPDLRWSADVTAATAAVASPAQQQSPAADVAAQDAASGSTQAGSEAVLGVYSGGAAEAKRARTETTAATIGLPLFWVQVPNAILSYSVPFLDTDLLNVSFSAECTKVGGGQARIRVLDNGIPMQPYDGAQVFCSSLAPATYTGTWTRRVGAGAHTIVVQIMNTGGSVIIDDWTFELVAYN